MVAKKYQNASGGLNAAGRAYFNNKDGSNLQAPAPNPKTTKAKNRKKSFCARMSGVKGPMKKPNGEPTRKALALKKWKC
tara:strand:- start:277 stop:513 length:237 start_codon:yes stop_codon:yes gene_type:complete